MALTTPVSTTANSYTDVAFADAYFGNLPSAQTATWAAASTAEKEAALIAATQMLEARNWVGTKTHSLAENSLRWPRSYVANADGQALDASTVPIEIQRATTELAQQVLTGALDAAGNQSQDFPLQSVAVGSVKVAWDTERGAVVAGKYFGLFPNVVEMLIAAFVDEAAGMMRLVRG